MEKIEDAACLEDFVIHSSTYYNNLLMDLDERIVPDVPITKPYSIVPPLLLKRSMNTPRAKLAGARIGFSRPGTSRTNPEELTRREENRIEFLCEIEAKKAMAHMGIKKQPHILRKKKEKPNAFALKVEEELIEPYRRNEEKYEALMLRVEKIEKARELKNPKIVKVKRSPRLSRKKNAGAGPEGSLDMGEGGAEEGEGEEGEEGGDRFEVTVERPISREAAARRATVLIRRNTLLACEEENVRRMSQQWASKITALEVQEKSNTSLNNKAVQWITLLTTVNRMTVMGNIVRGFRRIKEDNLAQWKACRTIQRYWRKWCPSNRGHVENKSFIHMFRKSMGPTKAARQLEIFTNRVNAATMITHFLRNKGFKVAVLQFLVRVRRLQRKIRDHLVANKHRCDVLSKLMDHCLPALLIHIPIVASGHGYDLKNLNSFEENQIYRQYSLHKHRFTQEMMTPAFHRFLRQNMPRLALFSKDLLLTTMANNKQFVDQKIKKPLLLDYVFKRRRQFGMKFNSQLRIDIDIPTVTVEDVRRFIQEGVDPVTDSLWALAKKEHDMLEDYRNRRTKGVLKVNEKMVVNTMAFYKEATVYDITLLLMSLFEKANLALYPAMMNLHHLTALAASGGVTVTSSMMKRQSVMTVDPRGRGIDVEAARERLEAVAETPPSSAGSGHAVMTSSAPLVHRRPSVSQNSGSNSLNNSGDHSHLINRRPSTEVPQAVQFRRPSTDGQSIKSGLSGGPPPSSKFPIRSPLGSVPEDSRGGRKASVMVRESAGGGGGGGGHGGFQPSLATVRDIEVRSVSPTHTVASSIASPRPAPTSPVFAAAKGFRNRMYSE